jgi:hypothetical protein
LVRVSLLDFLKNIVDNTHSRHLVTQVVLARPPTSTLQALPNLVLAVTPLTSNSGIRADCIEAFQTL